MEVESTIIIYICLLGFCNAIVLPCKESVESKLCLLVDKVDEYVTTKSPDPIPTLINSTVTIIDVTEVDEEKKTATLVMKINLEWFDFKLDVKRSKKENET